MRLRLLPLVLAGAVAASSPALADPILPPPGAAGFDPALEALAAGYQRQQDVFATLENGLSLDPIFNPGDVQSVKDFFAQSATDDFQAFSGKHPFEALAVYDEHGDEGNFAGIASVGVAARLMSLRASGAPAAEIQRARDAAVRTARAWLVYGTIGGPGVVARGVRRVTPWNAGDPPFPGPTPDVVPLDDGNGNPLPEGKQATWRAPVAPGFDGWIWFDDTSKDQVSGYALATAWLWDALHDDPEVPADVIAGMADGLAAFARSLMEVAPELGIDLCIRDADGRLTSFHDLNARQLSPDGVLPEDIGLKNGFNAALALGVIRAAYHVSGDPAIGAFYYEDLVGTRDYPALVAANSGIIFLGSSTNYSNVNMLTIALATLGRFETDPYVRSRLGETLETQYWAQGSDRDVSHVRQAWYDTVYAASAAAAPAEIRQRVAENLGGFQVPPAFERDRVNCDDAELAAKLCLAIDGVTQIEIMDGEGHGGGPVAKDILPMSIRPDSDFAWRSDPHQVNGSATTRMDPGGDFLAAYWLARVTDLEDDTKNVSPFARPPLPYTLGAGGAGGAGGGGGAGGAPAAGGGDETSDDGGCSCEVPRGRATSAASLGALALALAAARGRARRRAPPI